MEKIFTKLMGGVSPYETCTAGVELYADINETAFGGDTDELLKSVKTKIRGAHKRAIPLKRLMLAAAIISVLAAVAVPAFSNNEFTEFAGGAITQKNEIKLENGKVIKTCRTAALPLMLEKSDKRTSTNQNTWLADVFRKYGHDEMLLPQLFCSDNYASNVKFINKKGDGRAGSFVALYNTNKYFETVDSEKEKISLPCDLLVYEYEGFSDENDKLVLCNENYPVVEFEKYYADGTPVYFMRISESEDGFIRFIAVYTDGRYVYSIQSRCENKKNITEEKQEMFIEMIRSIK